MDSGVAVVPKRRVSVTSLREEPTPKRPKNVPTSASGSVNLVYPFGYNVAPLELNPPFLDSTGPLYEQNGRLAIRLANPLAEQNRAITLNYDSATLGLTSSGNLTVQVDPEGPMNASSDGLTVKVDGLTIEVDQDWELAVKTDPEGPIQPNGSQGLTVNVDDTLLIAQDPTSMQYELGLNLSTAGPLTADENGLDLEYDQESMQLLSPTAGSSGPLLAVRLKPGGGIEKGADGLYATAAAGSTLSERTIPTVTASPPLNVNDGTITLSVDPLTMQTGNGTLAVNLKEQGGLQTGTSGIGVAVDQSLAITNNTLEVKPDSAGPVYLTPNGVNVRTDNQTINVTNGNEGPQLSVTLDPEGCLLSLANVIKLVYTPSLDIQNNSLTVKLKPDGGLASDENGIYLANTALTSASLMEEGTSSSINNIVRLSSGDPKVRTVCGNVFSNQGVKFPCSYYLIQTNCDGLLTTVLTLRLQAEQLTDRTTYNKETAFFTFWVSTTSSADNPTALQAPDILPKSYSPEYFEPLVQRLGTVSPLSLTADTLGGDKYQVCAKGFVNQSKNPYLDAQIAPVLLSESSAIVFMFTVTPDTCIFDPDAQGDIILGPLTYCCPAKVVGASS
ncbi:fiber 2 [Psittacine adenovirus 1]|uniref:Fiber 2 n=1 Tax=Psittacine adenovirus 1 TaxID=318592 RepID=A0A2Z5E038_9ADEN|nr:fiber 2 [Psittacine adenovirus 1]AXB73018.1 fiber 2 [Psittacine adenovirus 1]